MKASLCRQQRELEEFNKFMSTENKWLKAFLSFRGAKELTRNMAQALLERVEVYEERRIHIVYRFRNEYEYLMSQLKDTSEETPFGYTCMSEEQDEKEETCFGKIFSS